MFTSISSPNVSDRYFILSAKKADIQNRYELLKGEAYKNSTSQKITKGWRTQRRIKFDGNEEKSNKMRRK